MSDQFSAKSETQASPVSGALAQWGLESGLGHTLIRVYLRDQYNLVLRYPAAHPIAWQVSVYAFVTAVYLQQAGKEYDPDPKCTRCG